MATADDMLTKLSEIGKHLDAGLQVAQQATVPEEGSQTQQEQQATVEKG